MRYSIFFLILTSISVHFSCLQAQIVLDEVMSSEVQKKTGVANLNKNQKIALEAWLDQNFIPKVQSKTPTTELSFSMNIDQGQKVQLSDNSLWEVSPDDIPTSAIWLTPFPIKITSSDDLNYPCLIVNKNSGNSVKARRISPPMTPTGK